MINLRIYDGPLIDTPKGIVSIIDAPILMLISVGIIVLYFVLRNRNKSSEAKDSTGNDEFNIINNTDILMQPKITPPTLTVDLYKSLVKDFHVVITATITENGGLVIHDFDGSKRAHETVGSDVETWIEMDKVNVDKLIKKLNRKSNGLNQIFKLFSKNKSESTIINNRLELVHWFQTKHGTIDALSKLKQLFDTQGIKYKTGRY